MDEYIKRKDALEIIKRTSGDYATAFAEICKIPAADISPVVYGEWGAGRFNLETENYEEQCTHCRNFSQEYDKPYCPNCGAKMSGSKWEDVQHNG